MENWMVIVGASICGCALVAWLISLVRRGRSRGNVHIARTANASSRPQPPPLPLQPTCRTGSGSRRSAPPPLPGEAPAVDPEMYDYPKCPVDRLRNTPGKPQAVFRDPARRCYYCARGHRFTGREH